MNKIYKVVWNKSKGMYVVVSEFAKSTSKAGSYKKLLAMLVATGVLSAGVLFGGKQAEAGAAATTSGQYVAVQVDFRNDSYINNRGQTVKYRAGDTRQFDGHKYVFTSVQTGSTTTNYWIREGYALASDVGQRHPGASNSNLLRTYKTINNPDSAGLLQTSQVMTQTDLSTLNQLVLNDVSTGVYLGAVNTGATDVVSSYAFYIERNGKYINVGGNNFKKNFKEVTWNSVLNSYTYNGKVVSNDNLYAIEYDGGQHVGVFVTSENGNEIYTGRVFGFNNEVLVTQNTSNSNGSSTVYSYWGSEMDDPNVSISSMTVGQFNATMDIMQNNIEKVHGDNIKEIKVESTNGGGTINLQTNGIFDANGNPLGGVNIPGGITMKNMTVNKQNIIRVENNKGHFDLAVGSDNTSVAVKGDTNKVITITDSAGKEVSTNFTDKDTTYTAGTGITIDPSKNNQINVNLQAGEGIEISGNTITSTVTDTNTTNKDVTVTGDTNKVITITDSAGNSVIGNFTDKDTTYTAGTGVTIDPSKNNQISVNLQAGEGIKIDGNTITSTVTDTNTTYTAGTGITIDSSKNNQINVNLQAGEGIKIDGNTITNTVTDTNTTNKDITVTGDANKVITITDSAGNSVSTTFVDKDTTYTAGTGIEISEDNVISVTFTDHDTTYSAGSNITISEDNVINAKDTTNAKLEVSGEAEKTITLTDSEGGKVTANFTDNDTTYTAGNGIHISDDNVISVTDKVETVTAGWDGSDKHSITIELQGSGEGGSVTTIGEKQTIGNIALSSEVGDVEASEYVANFEKGTTLVEAVNETYDEAKKHTSIVLGEGENNLVLDDTGVNSNGGTEYTLKMNENININSATIGGNTTINNEGVTTNNITTNTIKVGDIVINDNGINAGGNQITNVAAGKEDTDAVNVSQLNKEENARKDADNIINNRIDKIGGRINKVGAGAAALAALHPMEFDPDDKLSFAAGFGHYKGENATALGAYYRPDEKVMFSLGGTIGNGQEMVNVGASFSLDRTPNKTNTKTAMAKEIVELRERLAQMEEYMMKNQGFKPVSGEMKLFPDVPENHWAYEYISKLYADGVIQGYPDGNFAGDRMMTRYEFAAMLYKAMQAGANLDSKILGEFEPELCRVRVDRISGADNDYRKVERVRVNTGVGKDKYGNKIVVNK